MAGPLDVTVVDIVITILILVPGFIAVQLSKRIYLIEKELSDFEVTVWSVFTSFLIYIPFGAITGLASIDQLDKLRLSLFSIQNIAILLGLSLTVGALPAFILRLCFKRRREVATCGTTSWKRS